MRLHRIVLATVALTLALAPLSARAAGAAPDYVTSSPADGEKLASAPAEVWIAFTLPLDQSSKMRVVDECDRRVDDGNIEVTGNRISVGIDKEPSGHYIVTWVVRAPSGATGDGAGTFHFEVTSGTSCGGGRGGHSGHGGGGDNEGGKHEGHGGGGCTCDGKHDGHSSGAGTYSSSGHTSSGTHSSGHSSDGMSGGHAMGGDHDKGKSGKNEHSGHEEPPEVLSKELAAPGDSELPSVAGSDVLIALLICMVMGAAGGYVVRNGFNV